MLCGRIIQFDAFHWVCWRDFLRENLRLIKNNQIFASGWTWGAVQAVGLIVLAGFWERFFAVAFHIAVSALAGYGLARGWGWQFYLLAAFLHGLLNYGIILLQAGIFTIVHIEIYVAVVAVLVTAVALWLRWRKSDELVEAEV